MRVLVVGGAGEVGRHLVRELSGKGHEITILDRAPKAQGAWENGSITYLQGDISDMALVSESVKDKNVVIHLAWSFSDDPRTVFEEDIKGHSNLLEAASSSGISSFIYTSTATVYGRSVLHPVTESHPCIVSYARKPLYALGKCAAEEICKYYHDERGLPTTIFRFWWAFGDTIGGRHLRSLIGKSLNHEPLEMVSGAGGGFVTIADLGSAVLSTMTKPTAAGQVYNLGSLFLSWEEIGTMIVRLTESSSPLKLIPADRWKGPAFLKEIWDLSWVKAERELGYTPGDSTEIMLSRFEEALRNCIAEVKSESR